MLYVKQTKKMGRGVFTDTKISKGDVIEIAELIIIPVKDEKKLEGTIIEKYYYFVDENSCGIATGFGSLYNHSTKPNADWKLSNSKTAFIYYALRDIPKNAQIFIDYGYNPLKGF